MSNVNASALEKAIEALPLLFPGPGGSVAVVKDGQPIIRHGWGFANLETRQPFTTATMTPICSITKQFTCATMLSVAPDPDVLDPLTAAMLPRLAGEKPTTRNLANNQSGLRDYWALTVLCGAMPEGDFRPEDAVALIGLTRSLHFRPGTGYSYSNGNFRILSLAIAEKAGRSFDELIMERTIAPIGMEAACFCPETSALPGGAAGYEGTLASGWREGRNHLHWSGDAGICASIDDLVQWERFIDRTRDDAGSLYSRLSQPVSFRDGSPALYGMGLAHRHRWGRAMTGHGGAIRGWRLQRFWVPSERLSVDIAFNHESDSHGAAMHVLAAALGENAEAAASDKALAASFAGTWLDRETGLLLDVTVNDDGRLSASYAGGSEVLGVGADGVARGLDMALAHDGSGLRITRPGDGISSLAVPTGAPLAEDIAGRYRCRELDSELEIFDAGGSWFAGFRGFLGSGPLMPMAQVGKDVWQLTCRRSLDAPSPGTWTLQIRRSPEGRPTSISVGCWLARNVLFEA